MIGAGLVGSSIAFGLCQRGAKVAILDEGDCAFRASRGNFGLVWVQGKGWDFPDYAKWTAIGSNLWPEFDQELKQLTGVDVQYQRPGGLEFCLSESDWNQLGQTLEKVKGHTGGDFKYQMLEHSHVKSKIKHISNEVVGASFSPLDGHVNPLYLLRAMHQFFVSAGAVYLPHHRADQISCRSGEFVIEAAGVNFSCGKVVLCAGLDNGRLGNMLNIDIPVRPNRGQLLITERVQPFLQYPTLQVRQTAEGGLQIGDSSEDAGLDDRTSRQVITMLARRAVKIFPILEDVKLVRAWSALRVMSPDGKPIYQQSQEYPGAYGVACHSGVTLAAIHRGPVSDWIMGAVEHPLIASFSTQRFNV